MEKFQTAAFTGISQIEYTECIIPELTGNQVLLKIDACAVCTWEQRVYAGKKEISYPFIGGHEIAGTIVKLGPEANVQELEEGDRVVAGVMIPCRNCRNCKNGNQQNCLHYDFEKKGKGLPYNGFGGFSEYLVVPDYCCFKYENISESEAALIEPLSCVIHSIETADIQLGDTVLVIGGGIMGLLHAAVAVKKGAVVIVSDHHEERLNLAKQLGASYTVNPYEQNLEDYVDSVTGGNKAGIVIDTTPSAAVLKDCFSCVAAAGKIVLYSSIAPAAPVSFDPNWIHAKGIRILGTANSNERDYERACRLASQGIIDLKPFISDEYPFSQLEEALKASAQGKKFRIVVKFQEELE
ncbi:zinc-dependent alcohol dehydrogenase [Anaerostipes sp.]|uniref:zinc-dependent alcohol dehydrogenase n=1 Tax=Anaerostipes sp. TaxID=1872530 RepID=UPI0025C14EE3|nr:alcohol dehydrogenase catalytic domain-containing protein [Anaerostipes sp.]MBS7007431.1 alcohol dehydrogenase catalytic domain-containing protein [Anaerostipes sp.]